jgi:ribose transport system ATP-binding protein
MAVTFQHPELAEDLTVMENMQLAAPNLKGPEGRAEAERLLAEVASEQHAMSLKARVRDLTLAQHHVIELARALATKPEALLLDEPTEPFQQADIDKLFDLIKRLREEGVGIVYVSHRLHEIEKLADRITVLRDGRIISTGPAHQITPDQIVTMIAGQPLRQKFPAKSRNVGDAVLEVKGLAGPGFENVNFAARACEIVGITGIEGEGQREFLRTIAGLERRAAGSVEINGATVSGDSVAAARRAGIGFVTEDRHEEGLFLSLKLRENIGIGALHQISSRGIIDKRRDIMLSEEVIARLGVVTGMITEDDDTLASDLSGGNQQKTLIGRELAGEPEVLLIDEPTKGVDVGARSEIYQRLRELAESGYAVVVSSSDGIELEGLCDRVAVFARGQIVCELSDEELTDEAITAANMTATVARSGDTTRQDTVPRWRRIMAADHFPAVVLAVLTSTVLFGTGAINEFFLTAFNIETMLTFLAILAFISIGQLATILVGRIDLSVGRCAGRVCCGARVVPDARRRRAGGGVIGRVTGSHHRCRVRAVAGLDDHLAQHPGDCGDTGYLYRPAGHVACFAAASWRGNHRLHLRRDAIGDIGDSRRFRGDRDHRRVVRVRPVPIGIRAPPACGRLKPARRYARRRRRQSPHFTGLRAVGIICGDRRADFGGPGGYWLARHWH